MMTPLLSPTRLLSLTLLFHATITFTTTTAHGDNNADTTTATDRILTSNEHHQLQREAMYATLQSHHRDALFSSVQEQRSYSYFHSGIDMAAQNTMTMSGRDRDDAEKIIEDEDAYLQHLEDALEKELAEVRKRLTTRDATIYGKEDTIMQDMHEHDSQKGSITEHYDSHESHSMDGADKSEPAKRLRNKFEQEYRHFQCHKFPLIFLPTDVEIKWKELRRHFWEFTMDHRPPSDDDKTVGYVSNPDLFLDVIPDDDSSATQSIGLFAARDFESGETVYSQKTNAVYFQEVSMWSNFLHSLPSAHSSCLALEWTLMKQISRPGRWLLSLVLDEGVLMRYVKESKEDDGDDGQLKNNVALEDERSFDLVALLDIKKGDEILGLIDTDSSQEE